MKSEFYINHDKFQNYSDKAVKWLTRSYKYKFESDEWKICRLKYSINKRKALKHIKQVTEYLND
jgi:hypothetical protein